MIINAKGDTKSDKKQVFDNIEKFIDRIEIGIQGLDGKIFLIQTSRHQEPRNATNSSNYNNSTNIIIVNINTTKNPKRQD